MTMQSKTEKSFMRQEIEEIPTAVQRFLDASRPHLEKAGASLRERNPVMIATIARGSSDHASAYFKYATELTAGVPVASIGPSIMSIYGRQLKFAGCASLAISQSGKSPDIVAMAQSARKNGALSFAITNTLGSPLDDAADFTIDLNAGVEKSVAATKTYVNSVVAGLALLAHWQQDEALLGAIDNLPAVLAKAVDCDWGALIAALDGHQSLYVLGRGPSAAIASEAALKFKETCGIHAEAYSSAEVAHGPKAIVKAGYPVLALAARDAAESSVIATADSLVAQGGAGYITSANPGLSAALPFAASGHPITDPLALVVSFYGFIEALARRRGFNPDQPPNLKKVTETI
jgi:glucosamine--fructose-6-phosphate aminotransferase (isomerizing)